MGHIRQIPRSIQSCTCRGSIFGHMNHFGFLVSGSCCFACLLSISVHPSIYLFMRYESYIIAYQTRKITSVRDLQVTYSCSHWDSLNHEKPFNLNRNKWIQNCVQSSSKYMWSHDVCVCILHISIERCRNHTNIDISYTVIHDMHMYL